MRHNKVLKQNETTSGKTLSPACGTVTVACGFCKYGCGSRPGYLFEHPKDYVTTSVGLCHLSNLWIFWFGRPRSNLLSKPKQNVESIWILCKPLAIGHGWTWHGCSASLESRTSLHGVPLPLSRRKPPEH